jgi:hypothetical protein
VKAIKKTTGLLAVTLAAPARFAPAKGAVWHFKISLHLRQFVQLWFLQLLNEVKAIP